MVAVLTSVFEDQLTIRRTITSLFVDLCDSTRLVACVEPEIAQQILIAYRDLVESVILRNGGRVEKYVGDGVLAEIFDVCGWTSHKESAQKKAAEIAALRGQIVPTNTRIRPLV